MHGALAGRLLAIRGYLTMIIMVRGPNFSIAGPVWSVSVWSVN